MSQQTEEIHPKYIDPVKIETLRDSANEGGVDPGTYSLLQAEQAYIRAWRKRRKDGEAGETDDLKGDDEPRNLIGLALSGGGIRSATFSLGIMQALAHKGVLSKVDYLSTVSGGGYIGSALSWLVSDKANGDTGSAAFGVNKGDFPFGTTDPAPEQEQEDSGRQRGMLNYLRSHGYYLTPGAGISLSSLLGVVLRGTLLNLMVWLPAFVLFFLFGMWGAGQLGMNPPVLSFALDELRPAVICAESVAGGSGSCDRLQGIAHTPPPTADLLATLKSQAVFDAARERLPQLFGFELVIWLSGAILLAMLLSIVIYSLMTWFSRGKSGKKNEFWYNLRRFVERATAKLLPLVGLGLIIGLLPIVAVSLHGWMEAVGPVAMFSGIAIAIRDFLKSGEESAGETSGVVVSIGAGLFLFGFLVVAYLVAFWVFAAPWVVIAAPLLLVAVLVLGWFVNLNYISIHRYYRDRLMETFMPDIGNALQDRTGRAMGANEATLHEVAGVVRESGQLRIDPRGPFHIVNTNVVLVNSKEPVYQDRGGDNFILSPLYCGSNATGWCRTEDFMNGKMTLATAVAISGAAANPNTGVGGVGLTRNRLLSLVMSLLNLRLGYWATRPGSRKCPSQPPNHFRPGAYSFGNALGVDRLGFNEQRAFVQLSDGGHFENSGVYELVRRRMKLIIACDAGADLEFSFSDFQTTIRRIEEDFGARVKVLDGAAPDNIVPVRREDKHYPKDAKFADQGHMVGHITYADKTTGWLIFMKTTLIEPVSFKVKGYAAQNRTFPDQTTADQFFDEVQFEAYRELGYRIADEMLGSGVPNAVGKYDESLSDLIRLEDLITHFGAGSGSPAP